MKKILILIYLFLGAILLIFFNTFILPRPTGFLALTFLSTISTLFFAYIFFRFTVSQITIPKTLSNGMISHDVKLSLKEIKTGIIIGCILSITICVFINASILNYFQSNYRSDVAYLNMLTAIPCFVYWFFIWKLFGQSDVFSSIYIKSQRNFDKIKKKNVNLIIKKENNTAIEKKSEEETIQSLERKIKIKELQRELDELQKEEKD